MRCYWVRVGIDYRVQIGKNAGYDLVSGTGRPAFHSVTLSVSDRHRRGT